MEDVYEGKYEHQKMKSNDQVKLEYEIFGITKYLDDLKVPSIDSEHKSLSLLDRIKFLYVNDKIEGNEKLVYLDQNIDLGSKHKWDYKGFWDAWNLGCLEDELYYQLCWNKTLISKINFIILTNFKDDNIIIYANEKMINLITTVNNCHGNLFIKPIEIKLNPNVLDDSFVIQSPKDVRFWEKIYVENY